MRMDLTRLYRIIQCVCVKIFRKICKFCLACGKKLLGPERQTCLRHYEKYVKALAESSYLTKQKFPPHLDLIAMYAIGSLWTKGT
jgi:hypothetical protein